MFDFVEHIKNGKILYHGSRTGITGKIAPSSRENCDFGTGFYMGTVSNQTKALVASADAPYSYAIRIAPELMNDMKIVNIADDDWLYAVLYYRQYTRELINAPSIRSLIYNIDHSDFAVGLIADDRMVEVVRAFSSGTMTTKGLEYCLKKIDIGYQVVAKSQRACDILNKSEFHKMTFDERNAALRYGAEKREESEGIVNYAINAFRRDGLYIDEMLDKVLGREVDER